MSKGVLPILVTTTKKMLFEQFGILKVSNGPGPLTQPLEIPPCFKLIFEKYFCYVKFRGFNRIQRNLMF